MNWLLVFKVGCENHNFKVFNSTEEGLNPIIQAFEGFGRTFVKKSELQPWYGKNRKGQERIIYGQD